MRLYLRTDHRTKVHGMSKGELVSKVQHYARANLGLEITKKFLHRFSTLRLYDALRAAQQKRASNDIFVAWKDWKQTEQLKLL